MVSSLSIFPRLLGNRPRENRKGFTVSAKLQLSRKFCIKFGKENVNYLR